MSTITETSVLRSAFLKIGWAPIVTIGGTILLSALAFIIGINSATSYSDGMGMTKIILILTAVVGLTGYIMSYLGFAQAHKAFGITKAGDAFATLKLFFLIYCIIGTVFLIMAIALPSSAQTYIDFVNTADTDIRRWATLGIIFILIYIILAAFTIISLFVIMNKTATIAATTNIEAMRNCARGARYGVYCFFAGIVIALLSAAIDSLVVLGLCEGALLIFTIFTLVKWAGGWLEGATEVLRHPVEAEDYGTNQPTE